MCLFRGEFAGLILNELAGLIRGVVAAEELVDKTQAHRELVGGAIVHGKHAVLVVGEIGELIAVIPHALIRGVEEVRAVLVHLDSGGGFGLGVGIAAEVVAALHNEHLLIQLASGALGNR